MAKTRDNTKWWKEHWDDLEYYEKRGGEALVRETVKMWENMDELQPRAAADLLDKFLNRNGACAGTLRVPSSSGD